MRQFRPCAYEVLYGDLVPWLPPFVDRLNASLVANLAVAGLVRKLAVEMWSDLQFVQMEMRAIQQLKLRGLCDSEDDSDSEDVDEDDADEIMERWERPASIAWKARYDGWESAAVEGNTDSKAISELFDIVQHLPRLRSLALHELLNGEWKGGFEPNVAAVLSRLETLVYRLSTLFEPPSRSLQVLDALLFATPKLRRIDCDDLCLRSLGDREPPSLPLLRTLRLWIYWGPSSPPLDLAQDPHDTQGRLCIPPPPRRPRGDARVRPPPHVPRGPLAWHQSRRGGNGQHPFHSTLEHLHINLASFPSCTLLLAALPPSLLVPRFNDIYRRTPEILERTLLRVLDAVKGNNPPNLRVVDYLSTSAHYWRDDFPTLADAFRKEGLDVRFGIPVCEPIGVDGMIEHEYNDWNYHEHNNSNYR